MPVENFLECLKENLLKRSETDRIMWFSMWFLTALVTFGAAFFPMTYLLIERRNRHFTRQKRLEQHLTEHFKLSLKAEGEPPLRRNALFWTAANVLVIPAFALAYLLSRDLLLHEKRQREFFEVLGMKLDVKPPINLKVCVILTLATLGLGGVYWLYKIFNAYNNHFKEQWALEDEILRRLEREHADK